MPPVELGGPILKLHHRRLSNSRSPAVGNRGADLDTRLRRSRPPPRCPPRPQRPGSADSCFASPRPEKLGWKSKICTKVPKHPCGTQDLVWRPSDNAFRRPRDAEATARREGTVWWHGALRMRARSVQRVLPHGRRFGDPHFDYKLAILDTLARHVTIAARWTRDRRRQRQRRDHRQRRLQSRCVRRADPHHTRRARRMERHARRRSRRRRRGSLGTTGAALHVMELRHRNSRNLKMRLDVIAADPALAHTVDTTWIDHVERDTERPSDHAVLIADFDVAPLITWCPRLHESSHF
jgi:hypothetical protein